MDDLCRGPDFSEWQMEVQYYDEKTDILACSVVIRGSGAGD